MLGAMVVLALATPSQRAQVVGRLAAVVKSTPIFEGPSEKKKSSYEYAKGMFIALEWKKGHGEFYHITKANGDFGDDPDAPNDLFVRASAVEKLPFDIAEENSEGEPPYGFVRMEDTYWCIRDRRYWEKAPTTFGKFVGKYELIVDQYGRSMEAQGFSADEVAKLGLFMTMSKDKTWYYTSRTLKGKGTYTYNGEEARVFFFDKKSAFFTDDDDMHRAEIYTDEPTVWIKLHLGEKPIWMKRVSG